MFKLLKTYLKPYWGYVVAIMILQIGQTMLTVYLPNMNAHIIDNGVTKGDIDYIWTEGSLMIYFSILQIFLAVAATWASAKAAFGFARDVRRDVFHQVQSYSEKEMNKFGAPTLITRATNDINQIQQVTMFLFTLIVSSPIMFVGGVIMSLEQDVPLSGVIAATLPVIVIVAVVFVTKLMPYFRRFQKVVDKLNLVLREQIMGVRPIRAFVREEFEEQRFERTNDEMVFLNMKTGRAMSLLFPIFMLVVNVSILAIMWFGGIRVDNGDMEIGAITAFITYMMYIMMSVLMSSMIFVMWPRAAVSAERVISVLSTNTTITLTDTPVILAEPKGLVEFDDVDFRYEGADGYILKDVTFTAKPGEVTAIIGSTGSGKTTLINLIPRLYDVSGGKVKIDGADVRDYSSDALAATVSIVPQKAFLFAGDVRSNMQFAKPDATDDEIWAALEIAQAADFLRDLAQGAEQEVEGDGAAKKVEVKDPLTYEVAQGGSNFSGGQRQRLAIARALVATPKVYLFDDSFSALDSMTDAKLRKALSRVTKEAAQIIVAQKISTVKNAENIIVLDEGRIVGQGKHKDLIKDCETYKEIVDSQLTAKEALR